MTTFVRNELKARDAFQEEMAPYGITVEHSTTGRYANEDLTAYNLTLWTEPLPMKGRKSLIDAFQKRGYKIHKRASRTLDGTTTYVFRVQKTVTISTKDEEA